MSKRKVKRKSLIRVYIARAIAVLVILTMLILMFCGCLYIGERLFKKDDAVQSQEQDTDKETTPEQGEVNEQTDSETSETPNTPEVPIIDSTKYAGFAVMIDPGHGGNDGGTSSGDVIEKDVNLNVSLKLAEHLKAQGVEVFMTRDHDDYVSLEERVYKTNQTTADFFVSLHCNYFEEDSSIDGFEAFYCIDSPSDIYAENIVAKAQEDSNIAIRGAKANNYYVTRKVEMDGILIEMGFLSNTEECSKLGSEEYQEALAKAIANGIFATFDAKSTSETVSE